MWVSSATPESLARLYECLESEAPSPAPVRLLSPEGGWREGTMKTTWATE